MLQKSGAALADMQRSHSTSSLADRASAGGAIPHAYLATRAGSSYDFHDDGELHRLILHGTRMLRLPLAVPSNTLYAVRTIV